MRTFWIADPMPPSHLQGPLKWGSSEWAADSCLAEWSEFEREWTGEPVPRRLRRVTSKVARAPASAAAPLPPFLFACFVLLALGLGAFTLSVFRTLSA